MLRCCFQAPSRRWLHCSLTASAGHSKWAKIARSKGAADANRSVVFSKFAASIAAAVRAGGADPDANMRLATLIDKAKAANVPKDTIERALVAKAAADMETVLYEGVGPASIAVLVSCLTDNRKRTTQSIRAIFSKHGGELQSTGNVSWQFDSKGRLSFPASDSQAQERILEAAMSAGATDIDLPDGEAVVFSAAGDLAGVRKRMVDAGFTPVTTELLRIPQSFVDVPEDKEEVVGRFIEWLEENSDVEEVFHNAAG